MSFIGTTGSGSNRELVNVQVPSPVVPATGTALVSLGEGDQVTNLQEQQSMSLR